ncbi:MAG TPA: 3-deoxy-manno-octulosonate cytidylyltransferase [Pyrinomonadaceae bacterium]|nr:3-deoxy-manno-octulosonate cytidylyltransferase [Pyrinomonadaceae bacterium]
MIHTGSNPQPKAVAVIPARYSSTRLPGKPLLEIAGKPLIVWVAERARAAATISRTIIATDDSRIADAASSARFDVVMTRADHQSGTDRIAEVAHNLRAEIIVNVQGDEPLIDPATIDRVVNALVEDPSALMVTTYESLETAGDVLSASVVKVAFDEHGYATNFSRNPIPFPTQAVAKYGSIEAALRQEPALLSTFKKHTGLYAYRRDFLLEFTRWPQSERELAESLEQLRALDRGGKIKVIEAASRSIGVDTEEDLKRVRTIVEQPTSVAV